MIRLLSGAVAWTTEVRFQRAKAGRIPDSSVGRPGLQPFEYSCGGAYPGLRAKSGIGRAVGAERQIQGSFAALRMTAEANTGILDCEERSPERRAVNYTPTSWGP